MGIRDSFDTEAGLILATTLHTLGAIAVVAALVVHIAWYRRIRQGVHYETLHRAGFWLTLNAVAMNLVGGFMRTYLPGHPTLTSLDVSPWVQVMSLKHVFIFAALGALVYLQHWVAPRLIRRIDATKSAPRQTPLWHGIAMWTVATGVIIASVLGAMAQITPLGDEFEDHDMDDGGFRVIEEQAGFNTYQNASGTLSSTPLAPRSTSGTVQVVEGALLLEATLTYDATASDLSLRLQGPDDTHTLVGSGGEVVAAIEAPTPGSWTWTVAAQTFSLENTWQLSLRVASSPDGATLVAETVQVPPGSFFEINTQMPEDATFSWQWQTHGPESYFDVHSHFDGVVEYYEQFSAPEDEGSFTNDKGGGYSLLWANEGDTPFQLTYRVWGDFEVGSYFPPR